MKSLTDYSGLSDFEKATMILSYSERGENVRRVAENIIELYGSLYMSTKADPLMLMRACKSSEQSAVLLNMISLLDNLCAMQRLEIDRLDSLSEARRYFECLMGDFLFEYFVMTGVDKNLKIVNSEIISKGSGSSVVLSGFDATRFAVRTGSKYVFMSHNHPTSSAEMSDDDIISTKMICEVMGFVGVPVIDHIVVGIDGSVSAREVFGKGSKIFFTPQGYSADG